MDSYYKNWEVFFYLDDHMPTRVLCPLSGLSFWTFWGCSGIAGVVVLVVGGFSSTTSVGGTTTSLNFSPVRVFCDERSESHEFLVFTN